MRVAFLNAARIDFDRQLDFGVFPAGWDLVRLESCPDQTQLPGRIAGSRAIVTKELPLPAQLIARLPDSVEVICEAGTGFNNIDLDAARNAGIQVCNIPGYSTRAVAQLALSFVLNLSASLHLQQRMLCAGDQRNFQQHLQVPCVELEGKVLGLIGGTGAIGQELARLARALGMQVLISSRTERQWDDPGMRWESLDDVLERSDFISIHCPLNAQTRGLIGARELNRMKPGAYLINTARGGIVDQDALISALRHERIAGAALDVQDPEPPDPQSPLFELENLILTPHIGWQRLETRQRLLQLVADNLRAFAAGTPINIVS